MRYSALTLVFLAACGGGVLVPDVDDDGVGGNGEDGVGDEPVTTCDANPFTLRLDDALLAASSQGFDLDGHMTTSADDPVGCGKVDASGGIDNELADLAPTIESFGFDLEGALREAIATGEVVVDLQVAGFDGDDDDCVLLDAFANGDMVASSVEGTVEGGVLFATLPELPLRGDIDTGYGPTPVDLTLRDVHLELPLAGAPEAATVTGGLLGAGVPWDEGTSEDLRSLVLANLPSWLPAETVDGIVEDTLDLQPPGSGGFCDALSSALVVDASPL